MGGRKNNLSSSVSVTPAPVAIADTRGGDQQRRIQFFQPAYMESAGTSSMPWENWYRLFNYFLAGSDLDSANEKRKLAVLYGSLGSEAARIASDFTSNTTTYDETIRLLTERFGERQSIIFARTKFHQRRQQSGENILSYVTELRRLASKCRFGTTEVENVRDRLVAGCSDDKIRERLFQEPETITLDAAVVLAENVERASVESKLLASSRQNLNSGDSLLLKVDSETGKMSRSTYRTSSPSVRSQSPSSYLSQTCLYCGFVLPHRGQNCPAKGQKCNSCGRIGHFSRACRSKQRLYSKPPGKNENDSDKVLNTIDIAEVEHNGLTNSYVHVNLAGTSIQLLIDTGAQLQASVINKKDLNRLSPRIGLIQSNSTLRNFGGSRIPICETICVPVQYKTVSLSSFTFYVVESGVSILGQDLFDALDFHIIQGDSARIRALTCNTKPNL